MALWHLLLLAALQGVTEFLPISSSGHLILLPALTGLEDQGTFLDVAVHVGTLGAVVLYFRSDVAAALRGTVGLLRQRRGAEEKLALGLMIATAPVVVAGLLISLTIGTDALRSVTVIGWTTLLFGLFLWWCDQTGGQEKTVADWGPGQALKLGLWQAVALIPGTSRSGIVITGARAMGYERHEAARIAMLMSIPTILASGALLSLDAVGDATGALARDGAIAALFAFGAALAALHLMMRLLHSVDFTPYVIYRILLGTGLLIYAYAG
ncbi:undecaprenyl-diphosphate phosphatase [Jannaschia seohaensis]|uniref:Undecaprenyl-diphosphatase n=1 Tax=Jannaschia seohaensis TaxID=475081 RepID=A0A2Y9AT96_9RHOB|nr:undecaprenyl-diphosphate phosphatase [Jannaschia seohaensis]PWJ17504.1 undecaprenyl-diphosphatase [Jannaschia seohaensis]SSA47621.1 undecaprenyl-diphosphatase [Jannaschia seohaensis]